MSEVENYAQRELDRIAEALKEKPEPMVELHRITCDCERCKQPIGKTEHKMPSSPLPVKARAASTIVPPDLKHTLGVALKLLRDSCDKNRNDRGYRAVMDAARDLEISI